MEKIKSRLDRIEAFLEESSKRHDIEMKQIRKEMKEGIEDLRERQKKTDEQQKKTDEQLKRTDEQLKRTDEQLKRTDEKINKLISNWGKLLEALIKPSSVRLFRERGLDVKKIIQRAELSTSDGRKTEIDLLIDNTDTIILVEIKTTLSVNDVKEHIEKRLNCFYDYFPEYKNKKVYGAVAYLNVNGDADRYTYKNGLFVLTLSGEDMIVIKNDNKFIPKAFSRK